jgi:hypothetical protein
MARVKPTVKVDGTVTKNVQEVREKLVASIKVSEEKIAKVKAKLALDETKLARDKIRLDGMSLPLPQ